MQITVDGEDLYEITDIDMEILAYMLPSATLDAECKRRIEWIMKHKITRCYVNLRNDWMPILQKDPDVREVPLDDEAFFNMIKVRPDYKDRDAKDADAKAALSPPDITP